MRSKRLSKAVKEKVTHFRVARTGLANFLLAFLRPQFANAAQVDAGVLRLEPTAHHSEISLGAIKSVKITSGWVWRKLRIRHAGGERVVTGLSINDSKAFAEALENARADWWRVMLVSQINDIRSVSDQLAQYADPPFYLRKSVHEKLKCEATNAIKIFIGHWPRSMSNTPEIQLLRTVRDYFEDPDLFRKKANKKFVANELVRSAEFFDRFEVHPLTDEQRRAIIVDEDRNLVVAGAGSGKTSVIASKAGWLLKQGHRRSSELLLLAYAKAAQKEMKTRVHKLLGDRVGHNVTVSTFHSLGLTIIKAVDRRRPKLAKAAASNKAMIDLLKEIIDELVAEKKISEAVLTWFQDQFAPYRSQHDFKTRGAYFDYIRRFQIRTLQGDIVKSFEECKIANFLFINGISYKYEHPYEVETSTLKKGQYHPDFYLPKADIWIEHFGIDANGNTAPFVPQEQYLKSMDWKRNLHNEQGTTLVETFSYENADGTLLRNLEQKLRSRGVTLSPISPGEILASLSEQGFNSFIELIATFLHQIKSTKLSSEAMRLRAEKLKDTKRTIAFLNVFWPIFERYQEKLKRAGEIDFHDMILKATEYVEKGRYCSPFGYILVDEFQDIAADRARLLKALVDSSPGVQLFAVGDDWQAIFRFAGSDINIMRKFSEHFGECEQHILKTTFRCVDRIAETANEFILRNPLQIPKTIQSIHQANEPRVHLGLPGEREDSKLKEALGKIAEDAKKHQKTSTVLLLGRYRHLRPDNLSSLKRQFPELRINYMTIHGSKGLEADYVVVLRLCSGRFAFPSENADDPLLELVLPASKVYPNEEERRLFYVALTRARRHAFLLVEGGPPSCFASELIGDGYDITIFGRSTANDISCQSCVTGRIVWRTNKHRGEFFYSCSNFPYCKFKPQLCPECRKGLLVEKSEDIVCRDCDQSFEACPKCDGVLVTRKGKYGSFLGCTSYPDCNYTRNIGRKRHRGRNSTKALRFTERKIR